MRKCYLLKSGTSETDLIIEVINKTLAGVINPLSFPSIFFCFIYMDQNVWTFSCWGMKNYSTGSEGQRY